MIQLNWCLPNFPYITVLGFTLGLATLLQNPVLAHDYWFEREGQEYVLYRGHHFADHKGEAIVPYAPEIIQHISCVSPDGVPQSVNLPTRYPARIPGPCARLTVEVDSGYWSETGIETLYQSKEQVPDALYSWRAIESTTLLNTWHKLDHPPSVPHGLEIFFEKNPFLAEDGEKLRLVVLQAGKPRQGVTVAYDGNPRGVTGQDGRINIRIRHSGLQVITGSIKEPAPDTRKADTFLRSTTLLFELPDAP
jgi:nickel transport protein